jgi:hypothetical protein
MGMSQHAGFAWVDGEVLGEDGRKHWRGVLYMAICRMTNIVDEMNWVVRWQGDGDAGTRMRMEM